MRPKNMSLPTVRKVLNGARSRALDRTSLRAFRRVKSKDGPYPIVEGSSTLTPVRLEHGLADEVLLII